MAAPARRDLGAIMTVELDLRAYAAAQIAAGHATLAAVPARSSTGRASRSCATRARSRYAKAELIERHRDYDLTLGGHPSGRGSRPGHRRAAPRCPARRARPDRAHAHRGRPDLMAAAQILTARQGDKLDQLLWREGGLGPGDLTACSMPIPAADLGVILPLGTRVLVPAAPEATGTPVLPLSNSGADPPWTFALLLTRAPT
jgi:hypothetical protein